MSLGLVFLVLAAVLVLVRAFGITLPRVDLGWLGVFFFILSFIIK
jgi:hypothetical protein